MAGNDWLRQFPQYETVTGDSLHEIQLGHIKKDSKIKIRHQNDLRFYQI